MNEIVADMIMNDTKNTLLPETYIVGENPNIDVVAATESKAPAIKNFFVFLISENKIPNKSTKNKIKTPIALNKYSTLCTLFWFK